MRGCGGARGADPFPSLLPHFVSPGGEATVKFGGSPVLGRAQGWRCETGRRHDRARDVRDSFKATLDQGAPSRHDTTVSSLMPARALLAQFPPRLPWARARPRLLSIAATNAAEPSGRPIGSLRLIRAKAAASGSPSIRSAKRGARSMSGLALTSPSSRPARSRAQARMRPVLRSRREPGRPGFSAT